MMAVGAILSSPAIANSTIYIASTDGNIYALM
jgi:outer membrane protein assembly factor BamB